MSYWHFQIYCTLKKPTWLCCELGFLYLFSLFLTWLFFEQFLAAGFFCHFNCYSYHSIFKGNYICFGFLGELFRLSLYRSFGLHCASLAGKTTKISAVVAHITDRGWLSSKWIDEPGHGLKSACLGGWIDFEFIRWISPEPGEVGLLETPIQSYPSAKAG